MTIVFFVISLIGLSYALSRATDVLVSGLKELAEGTAMEDYGLTTLLVALATSLPELFVGVASALENRPSLIVGTVVGSNIATFSLILGGAALISGRVKAKDKIFRQDILLSFLIGSLPLVLMLDGVLSRENGFILLAVYAMFNMFVLRGKRRKKLVQAENEYYDDDPFWHRIVSFAGRREVEVGLGKFLIGSVVLVVSSGLIVELASRIATELGAPIILVGMFMVAVGTSLPELAFEIKTIRKREYTMAFANVVGSIVVNSTLVLGVVSAISPIVMDGALPAYNMSVLAFVLLFFVFWYMVYTKKTLERWEGAVLLGLYLAFVFVQISFDTLVVS